MGPAHLYAVTVPSDNQADWELAHSQFAQWHWAGVWVRYSPASAQPTRTRASQFLWRVPIAWPLLLTAVLPTCGLITWGRRRCRWAEGLCQGCGYDLRASRDRCPECGAAIPARPAAP